MANLYNTYNANYKLHNKESMEYSMMHMLHITSDHKITALLLQV